MGKYTVEVAGKQIGGSYSSNAAARKKATDIWETYGEEAHVIRHGGTSRRKGTGVMRRRAKRRRSSGKGRRRGYRARKTSTKSAYKKGYKAGKRAAGKHRKRSRSTRRRRRY